MKARRGWAGFTLVEIVVSLTVMALLVAVSVPAVDGVIREHQGREPLQRVTEYVRLARELAYRHQQPFQVGFDARGCFVAAFYQPYDRFSSYEELKREQEALEIDRRYRETAEARFGSGPEASREDPGAILERYEWPEGMTVWLRFWGDTEWEVLDGMRFRQWVIQPKGLAKPLWIRMEGEGVSLEARYGALSGEIEEERSIVR